MASQASSQRGRPPRAAASPASPAAPARSRSPPAGTTRHQAYGRGPAVRRPSRRPTSRAVHRGRTCLSCRCIEPIHRVPSADLAYRSRALERSTGSTDAEEGGRDGQAARRPRVRRPRPAARGPMHGYELRKRLNAVLGSFRAFSYGSLYPCLKHAASQAAGSPRTVAAAAAAARPGKRVARSSTSSPPRARSSFAELLAEAGPSAWEDEGFGVHFAFFARPTRRPGCGSSRPPLAPRGAPRRRSAAPCRAPGSARQLHPRAPAARARVRRARGPLAQRADRRASAQPPPGRRAPARHRRRHDLPRPDRRTRRPGTTREHREGAPHGFASA